MINNIHSIFIREYFLERIVTANMLKQNTGNLLYLNSLEDCIFRFVFLGEWN